MEIKVNYSDNDNYISNLAFIKSFFIKKTIESLDISYEEKKELYNVILKYLNEN